MRRVAAVRNVAFASRDGVSGMADIGKFLDRAHEQKEFAELADAPVDALQGVSAGTRRRCAWR